MNSFGKFGLLFFTLKGLSLSQMYYRGKRVLRRRAWRLLGKEAPAVDGWKFGEPPALLAGLKDINDATECREEIRESIQTAKDASKNTFEFLNVTKRFENGILWHDPELSQLWLYHLHYFHYVQDLLVWSAVEKEPKAYQTFRSLALSWIEGNRRIQGDGWHPYTLSLRVVNWIHGITGFKAQLNHDAAFRQRILASLYGQVRILAGDLERDVRGNHLLENLRALIWAGAAFEGCEPERWFKAGMDVLKQELAEQVKPDGGHFERSPGYHCVILQDCLEIALWLARNGRSVPGWLDISVRRMLAYLDAIVQPGGRLPLLKDTAFDAALQPQDLLAAGAIYSEDRKLKRQRHSGLYPWLLFGANTLSKFNDWTPNADARNFLALRESGHYVLSDDAAGDFLIFDAGKVCPDYLPAHAHADLLSFELCVNGSPVVVDSGIYEYKAGPWRNFFRSTRAHNTVEIDGQNQSEVWSSFRVARRAKPRVLQWSEKGDAITVCAEHDGYHRLSARVTHRRSIYWQKGLFWLVIDEILGREPVEAANHIHFHPRIRIQKDDENQWLLKSGSADLCLSAFGFEQASISQGQETPEKQGWYSERFGVIESNPVLALRRRARPPFCFGYVIAKEKAKIAAYPQQSGSFRFEVLCQSASFLLEASDAEFRRIE